MRYVHFGANSFSKEKFVPIENESNKPFGGFWASPVGADFGWDDFCNYAGYSASDMTKCFSFKLKDDAKVLHLRSMLDLDTVPFLKKWDGISAWPDFETLAKSYDAIELHYSSNTDALCRVLNGWDCDCIVIMNPDVIVT